MDKENCYVLMDEAEGWEQHTHLLTKERALSYLESIRKTFTENRFIAVEVIDE